MTGYNKCFICIILFYIHNAARKVVVAQSCLTLCDSMDCSLSSSLSMEFSREEHWNCHFLLQGIFRTQGSNPALLYCWWILYCLSHQESPILLKGSQFVMYILQTRTLKSRKAKKLISQDTKPDLSKNKGILLILKPYSAFHLPIHSFIHLSNLQTDKPNNVVNFTFSIGNCPEIT